MSNKKIAWEKWDVDLLEEELMDDLLEASSEDDDEDAALTEEAIEFMQRIPKLVTTPLGIFQMHDKMNILKQFECWMGYTNFDITHSVSKKMEAVDGVEFLLILSRYRFFLGVGKLFDFSNVRTDIQKSVCHDKAELDVETEATVEAIKNIISKDKHWAILVCNTGEIQYASTNDANDETYLTQLVNLELIKNRVGGLILQDTDES